MREPALILLVDDVESNLVILERQLANAGYLTARASNGAEALAQARRLQPDLILLDVVMPDIDGFEVCRQLKKDPQLPFTPIILLTSLDDQMVEGLDAGADEYLLKGLNYAALTARVRSMLRIKALHDTVQTQADALQRQADELAQWNSTLSARVAAQLTEIEGAQRMRRFVSPQIGDIILKSGQSDLLESHRRDITVVFCDLRGFTSFAESAEPEEVMKVLKEYHAEMGALIYRHEGTLERFTGDGLMVFFNDPVPCPDPAARALHMAVAMRERHAELSGKWQKFGHELGFGVGIASGYATLGKIGFEGRFDYGAIGSVTNLASRLCDQARHGQILISQRVETALEGLAELEPMPAMTLKGFRRPINVFNVVALVDARPSEAAQAP